MSKQEDDKIEAIMAADAAETRENMRVMVSRQCDIAYAHFTDTSEQHVWLDALKAWVDAKIAAK